MIYGFLIKLKTVANYDKNILLNILYLHLDKNNDRKYFLEQSSVGLNSCPRITFNVKLLID